MAERRQAMNMNLLSPFLGNLSSHALENAAKNRKRKLMNSRYGLYLLFSVSTHSRASQADAEKGTGTGATAKAKEWRDAFIVAEVEKGQNIAVWTSSGVCNPFAVLRNRIWKSPSSGYVVR